jgi:hypothetical protein
MQFEYQNTENTTSMYVSGYIVTYNVHMDRLCGLVV